MDIISARPHYHLFGSLNVYQNYMRWNETDIITLMAGNMLPLSGSWQHTMHVASHNRINSQQLAYLSAAANSNTPTICMMM